MTTTTTGLRCLLAALLLAATGAARAAGSPDPSAATGPSSLPLPAYVDDDAPGDPGPGDPSISDPLEDGTPQHPFDSIQQAIDYLLNPCSIVVMPGTYDEALTLAPSGCAIAGSGKTVTRVRWAGGYVLQGFLLPFDPSFPSNLSVRDLTLEGAGISLMAYANAGSQPSITLENMELLTDFTDVIGEGATLTMIAVGQVGGTLSLGAVVEDLNAQVSSLRLDGADLGMTAAGSRLTAELNGVVGPGAIVGTGNSSGGQVHVTLRDSTIGAFNQGASYRQTAIISNVRFTGAGVRIDSNEGGSGVSITGSTFESGGVDVIANPDRDGPNSTTIEIAGSLFRDEGVALRSSFGGCCSSGVYTTLRVDGALFHGKGITARTSHGPFDSGYGGSADLVVTNSLFTSPLGGVSIAYDLPDAEPNSTRAELSAAIVNNTLAGGATGIRIDTNPHAPGQDVLTTLLQNNIVASGAIGIAIHGTDDQQFTIAGNDVYGSSVSDYAGDVPDQTGLNGNISADPLFADPNAGDYRLTEGSPCIDAGLAGPVVPATDFAGAPRPQDGDGDGAAVTDMGAFEFVLMDADDDGFPVGEDCDDADPAVHPGAADLPGNAVDEDCDGAVSCDPSGFWKTHGMFVGCVARQCAALVTAGSADSATCEALVVQAARSQVGRPARRRAVRTPQAP